MNFKDDDKLNRERYADFIEEIIHNSNNYKRESDTKSFVLAIDSAWGTGKTTFLNMLEDKMNSKGENYTIINYNAWKSDAWENPFETLMSTILEHKVFNVQDDTNNLKTLAKDLTGIALDIGKSILKKQVSKVVPEEVIDSVKERLCDSGDYKRALMNESSSYDFFKDYREYENNINKMKKSLEEICKLTKLVVFIDELDRCKPTFAIKLLETIKHLFDVEGMSFVFALDIKQLSYCVQAVYGNGIDSMGYLCRFFDYISKLPLPNIDTYIDWLLEKNKLINYELKLNVFYGNKSYNVDFIDTFKMLAHTYNLSLRDINTIYSNFLIFEKIELSEVKELEIYQIYLTLIIMKYKYPTCFERVFIKRENIKDDDFVKKIQSINGRYEFIRTVSDIINNERLIKHIRWEEGYAISRVDIDRNKVIYIKESSYATWEPALLKSETYQKILTYNDLLRWEEIKDLTLQNYMYRKLEMFDFSWKDKLDESTNHV